MPRAQPGQRFGGRQKGTPNKVSGSLREAILAAATKVGFDGHGKDGLQGYLEKVAADTKTFSGLLGRVVPLQVGGDPDGVPIETKNQVVVELVAGSK